MNMNLKSVSDFGRGSNDNVLGGFKTLSKEDVFTQTRYFSNSNDFESWSVRTDEECNTYIEEYE